ncbi:hypothetical protein ACFL09_01195 [Planctomycetota bacterium]
MGKRALAVAVGLVFLAASMGFAGEKPKRKPRKKPEPVSTADYLKGIQQLIDAANELAKPDSAAKSQELRDKVKAAAGSLRLGGKGLEKMLEGDDNAALATRLKSYAYNSLGGKIRYEQQKLIKAKPELQAEYDKFKEREKQLAADKEAFYQKLGPQSPDIQEMEKVREALAAERKAAIEAKRKPKGDRKKKKEK